MCKSIVNFSTSLIIGLYDTFNNGNVIIIQLNYLLVSLILFIWILSYCCILILSISKNIFQTILPAPNVHIRVHLINSVLSRSFKSFLLLFLFFLFLCAFVHSYTIILSSFYFCVLNVCYSPAENQ